MNLNHLNDLSEKYYRYQLFISSFIIWKGFIRLMGFGFSIPFSTFFICSSTIIPLLFYINLYLHFFVGNTINSPRCTAVFTEF